MSDIDINTILSPDQRKAIIDSRIESWAVELYGHTLNRDAIQDNDPTDDTKELNDTIGILSAAIANARVKKAAIDSEIIEAEQKFSSELDAPLTDS